jgi:hypothetical protein
MAATTRAVSSADGCARQTTRAGQYAATESWWRPKSAMTETLEVDADLKPSACIMHHASCMRISFEPERNNLRPVDTCVQCWPCNMMMWVCVRAHAIDAIPVPIHLKVRMFRRHQRIRHDPGFAFARHNMIRIFTMMSRTKQRSAV